MKKIFFLAFFACFFLVLKMSVLAAPTLIGQCHGTNKLGVDLGNNINVSWGYDSGVEFFWSTVEPRRGVFNWSSVDAQINKHPAGSQVWIQVITSNDGNQTMPLWTISSNTSYPFPGTCESTNTCIRQLPEHTYPYRPYCVPNQQYKNGRPVQWDKNYLIFFEELIASMANRYDNNPKVEAILMMSGGNYGEMSQTYGFYCPADGPNGIAPLVPPCPGPTSVVADRIVYAKDKESIYTQEMLRVFPSETTDSLISPYTDGRYSYLTKWDYYYAENSKKLIDIYTKYFINKPVVLQIGNGISCTDVVAKSVADYAVETYGKRVWLKQNGWGNAASGYDPYAYFFNPYKDKTKVIREVGHPNQWCEAFPTCTNTFSASFCYYLSSCARTSRADAILHNNNAVKASIESGISAVCFQGQFLTSSYFYYFPIDFLTLKNGLEKNYLAYEQIPDTLPPSCQQRLNGDVNKDGVINNLDYQAWRSEFLSGVKNNADLNCDNKVSLIDFEIWRRN
ncbi:hypothetical protein KKF11_00530 [Patescibacteria group bacterium]|nr:hypothetical protein [Patescibacteria group bacterium]